MELAIAAVRRGAAAAWAYALRRDGEPVAEEAGPGRPGDALAEALAAGLERAAREGAGEDVAVRAAPAELGALPGGPDPAARAAQAAARLASVRIVPVPAGELAAVRARAEALLPTGAGIALARASALRASGGNRP